MPVRRCLPHSLVLLLGIATLAFVVVAIHRSPNRIQMQGEHDLADVGENGQAAGGLESDDAVVGNAPDRSGVLPSSKRPQDPALDTSDWKTYRNEEYGITFLYPPYEQGWTLETFDYADKHDSLLGSYEGISLTYDFKRIHGYDAGVVEQLTFVVQGDPFDAGNSHMRNPNHPDVYVFDFNGMRAVANKPWNGDQQRDSVFQFFHNHQCSNNMSFGLPDLPPPWTSNHTVSLVCGSSLVPKENPAIFRAVLDSVRFFKPLLNFDRVNSAGSRAAKGRRSEPSTRAGSP